MIPSAKCVVPTAQITGRINEGRKKGCNKLSLLLEQLAADSDSENSLNDENIFTLRRTKPKVNDTPRERHHFKQGTLDKPFILVAYITWSVKTGGPPVTNTCALDSILFAWNTIHKNNWVMLFESDERKRFPFNG